MNGLLKPLTDAVLQAVGAWGYLGVFVLMLFESANIPIPSEIIMTFAGYLVSMGKLNFWIVVFMGAAGNLAGSLISYWIAFTLKEKTEAALSKVFFVRRKDFEHAERFFARFGVSSAFFGRLVPIVRTFISFPAGMFRVELARFSALTFFGSAIWSLALAYLGFALGEHWETISPYFRKLDLLLLLIIAGVAATLFLRRKSSGATG